MSIPASARCIGGAIYTQGSARSIGRRGHRRLASKSSKRSANSRSPSARRRHAWRRACAARAGSVGRAGAAARGRVPLLRGASARPICAACPAGVICSAASCGGMLRFGIGAGVVGPCPATASAGAAHDPARSTRRSRQHQRLQTPATACADCQPDASEDSSPPMRCRHSRVQALARAMTFIGPNATSHDKMSNKTPAEERRGE